MLTKRTLSLIILIALAGLHCESEFVNFDAMVEDWVRRKAYSVRRTVDWWDLYGTHTALHKTKYLKYKIKADVCNFIYGNEEKKLNRPCSRDIRYISNNNATEEILFNTHGVQTLIDYLMWTVSDGIIMKTPVRLVVPTPTLVNTLLTEREFLEIDMQQPATRYAMRKLKALFETEPYPVPPSKSVKSEFSYVSRETAVPWVADVTIQGAIAVRYHRAYRNSYLWFYPVTMMAANGFEANGLCRVTRRVKGYFVSTEKQNVSLKMSRYELKRNRFGLEDKRPIKVHYISPTELEVTKIQAAKSKNRRSPPFQ